MSAVLAERPCNCPKCRELPNPLEKLDYVFEGLEPDSCDKDTEE